MIATYASAWKNRLLTEITPGDLRALCARVKDRGAPATAIHVRDIVKQIFGFAILHGEKVPNPADEVGPASIATFEVRDRALSPSEIRIAFTLLERIATLPTIRLGLKLILLTMVRKSELQDAVWTEVDFENAVWSIPKERMKRSKPHNVYLSQQSLDILIALKDLRWEFTLSCCRLVMRPTSRCRAPPSIESPTRHSETCRRRKSAAGAVHRP